MTWHPVGPDFVYAPRRLPYQRLSRRNEQGRQGLTWAICVDPTDSASIYVAERPSSGGSTAFRTRDDGRSWTPIADELQQADAAVDPSCLAVNPDHPEVIYLGTWSRQSVFVSSARGDVGSWGPPRAVGGSIRKLVVDPRFSATLATTVIYAATTAGVFRSADGGSSWVQVLAGDVWSLVATFPPASATPHFYAGVYGQGVFHATDPTAAWTNLNAAGIGLPAHTAATAAAPEGNFNAVLVDLVGGHPDRVYAWFLTLACGPAPAGCNEVSAALWTTGASTTSWTQIPAATLPGPGYGFYALAFGVAPNSPGNGLNDVLAFGNVGLQRSVDSGRTWQDDPAWFHADHHAIAFAPAVPAAGTTPTTFIGCDGGIAKSSKFADPATALVVPAHFNEGFPLLDSITWQNLDHGKQSSAIYQYASPEVVTALGYVGCQDTGVQAGVGSLGWRGIADADGGAIAAARGPNGVAVWGNLGAFDTWPSFRVWLWTDRGEFAPAVTQPTLGGSLLQGTSNHMPTVDDQCLLGAIVRDSDTTLSAAITSGAAAQAATPASMTNIIVGSSILIDDGAATAETVTVTAVTATTFSAVFTQNHGVGATLKPNRGLVARIDAAGVAVAVSQDFTAHGNVTSVGKPHNAFDYYCVTGNGKLWHSPGGAAPGPASVWVEVATGRPPGASITSIAQLPSGPVYVLLASPVGVGGATTPLFEVQSGSWVAAPSTGLPAGGGFGKLVADPLGGAQMFATVGSRVYELTSAGISGSPWTWTDRSENLPGPPVYDLWAGTTDPADVEKRVVVRAAIPTRGVWEREVSVGIAPPATWLYMRDNILDPGFLAQSPDGVPNPYDPTSRVWHYQSPDIVIDARQQTPVAGGSNFYQSDPEGNPVPPLDHVLFDELVDNSGAIPAADQARAHVIVRNRSETPVSATVWAIYARASGGVPSLAASPSMGNAFPFWGQFGAAGAITPNLPTDSPWKSAGPPQPLSDIDAAHPRIGTFTFTAPTLASGDPGHYCMVAFIHSASAPVGETTRMSVDAITPTNPRVAQKNLHIGPPLPPSPGPGGGSSPAGAPLDQRYVEFHNPSAHARKINLRVDATAMPAALRVRVRPSQAGTGGPLSGAVTGADRVTDEPVPQKWGDSGGKDLISRIVAFLLAIWCWLLGLVRQLLGLKPQPCGLKADEPVFGTKVFDMHVPGQLEISGVTLPPFGKAALLIDVQTAAEMDPGAEYRFEVQQWGPTADGYREGGLVAGRGEERGAVMLGGGTHVIRVAGEPKRNEEVVAPSHRQDIDPKVRERIEREAEHQRVLPPWAKEHVEKREKEQGRRP
jgi:hypothetical protein